MKASLLCLPSGLLALTLTVALAAQSDKTSKDSDWPMYNRDLAGTR